ncbi:hypothetical protein R80B4_01581 [Fibrobacteres bacterium R8-0-B4]
MIWVINAEWIGDYRVFVEFSDGVGGVIDFMEKLNSDHRQIVRDLLDIDRFNTVKVDYDTLCWGNGVDFAPEYLYKMVTSGALARQPMEPVSV